MALQGADDYEKLQHLCSKNYKEQAIHFLNAFWLSFGEKEAENIWKYKHKFDELDQEKKKEGNGLDELNAHRFLEAFNMPLTVKEMRENLRSTGAIKDVRLKIVPMVHILLFHYKANWHALVNAEAGDPEELAKAQALFDQANAALQEAQKCADELNSALAELKKQEDEYNHTTQQLTKKSEEGGAVARNKAKAELAQHLAADPLPLRRAKLNTEAAVRKAEKALAVANQSFAEAEAYLTELKSRAGSIQGSVWYMERELTEMKKYLPTSKGGTKK